MSPVWSLERGANVRHSGVHFSVWAPNAKRVRVRVKNVDGGATSEHELRATNDAAAGVFEATIPGFGTGADYGFMLDDSSEPLPDPVSRWQPEGVHGLSRVVDPNAYRWTDAEWKGVTMQDFVIYELHIGTFTPEGTFTSAIPQLRRLKRDLGVTAIEIMPVAQFPGERNWGYDGVDLYAPQNNYGGPEALRQLIDAAHAEGLAVIMDVVYNHVGPEGNYLNSFGPYFTEKYKTPWGPTVNYDDAQSDEVRRFVIDNALYWITEYHADGLRLDAVHGIFDMSAKHLLQELTEAVHAQADELGRRVVVIGESDLNDPRLLRAPAQGGYGLDGQWSDDFHHAVHAALTGETKGYYSDFGRAEIIGASLAEPFVYDGRYSAHRKRRHGGSSAGIPRQKFVVAIQNHDQIGNRAAGDRLSTTLSPDRLRLAAALLLLSPYVPLLFMGEEYGETNPFQYFVSHSDEKLAEAVREGRRKEFEAFGWGDDVPDPSAEETFRRSTLDLGKLRQEKHAQIYALYRDLLALRREEPLLRPDDAEVAVDYTPDGWITLLRTPGAGRGTRGAGSGRRGAGGAEDPSGTSLGGGLARSGEGHALLTVFNCSSERREMPLPESARGAWTLRLTTDAVGYGGGGEVVAELHEDEGLRESAGGWSAESDGPKRLVATAVQTARTLALPAWTAAVFER